MICHRRKFVFLHIGKTGGQSVEKALRPFAFSRIQRFVRYVDIRTTKRDPYGIHAAGSHPTATELRQTIGDEAYDSYYSFCFVRNPWSRLLSYYKFSKLKEGRPAFDDASTLDFNAFIAKHGDTAPMRQQSELLLNNNGQIDVDFVGRFETLENDFQTVCETLGCSVELPHKNSTKKSDFRTAYSEESVDRVARWFADDVTNFGYTFE
ncbi:sulfotransferase family protein [Octadecabacter sp. CECT 8868]|uniref:sulfotransferase family 2 domain-containing protein n=1 Tax=Octadecabacter algicola TaxID=2909342 RepID=UPI001F42A81E|nr:sulfotransferase family 2 domain-containing protein [Octadecabacter algicola]MCF2905043.1 sulfotransferase family protein [Octadecabacter algicola]